MRTTNAPRVLIIIRHSSQAGIVHKLDLSRVDD